jgi:hypothetical protein
MYAVSLLKKYPLFYLVCCLLMGSLPTWAQIDLDQIAEAITAEGKWLYRSEQASWKGSDIFLANFKDVDQAGGYFSYIQKDRSICVFFSKNETPEVLATFAFGPTDHKDSLTVSWEKRSFTSLENDLYQIRKIAINEANSDTLFKQYKDSNLNFIPYIEGQNRKVYVITGTLKVDLMLLGNDYLLVFDEKNQLISKKKIHKNIIPLSFGAQKMRGQNIEGSVHVHLPSTDDFITPTDVCTLMLYAPYNRWKKHTVISEKYLSFWNQEKNELIILTREAYERIQADQQERQLSRPRN